MKIIIIGAGIGGLCTAIALQSIGIEVEIYEKAPQWKHIGAGIALAPNALKALKYIGIDTDIKAISRSIAEVHILSQNGNILTKQAYDAHDANSSKQLLAVHRADLHEELLRIFPASSLFLDKNLTHIEQDISSCVVFFEDGSQVKADAIIAADGIHSIARLLYQKHTLPRYAGYVCWRAVIPTPISLLDNNIHTETWGKDGRFGITPISSTHTYWYAVLNTPEKEIASKKQYSALDLYQQFQHFHTPVPEVLMNTYDHQLLYSSIIDIEPLDKIALGRVVLIGDAAHATTPNLGQGACQAIEDAAFLKKCLVENKDVFQAFQQFQTIRLQRVKKIIEDSWTIGKIAQLENGLLTGIRNQLLQWLPESVNAKQMDFLYNIDL